MDILAVFGKAGPKGHGFRYALSALFISLSQKSFRSRHYAPPAVSHVERSNRRPAAERVPSGCSLRIAEETNFSLYSEAGFVTGIVAAPADFCGVVSSVGACLAGGGMSGFIFTGTYLSILSIT
jgi:hypothetical protein